MIPPPYATVRLDSAASTQDVARERFADEPLLVVADRQTGGRGRSGADWWQADRALYASLAFRPDWPAAAWPRLALVAGLAARAVLGGVPDLKWPNDLVVAEGKVGGVLVEATGGVVVAGLGVNLWWPTAPDGAAAVNAADPGRGAAIQLAERWVSDLARRVAAGPDGWGHAEYVAACTTVGHSVEWQEGGRLCTGKAVGVSADGALEVTTGDEVRRLLAGQVREVRTATLGSRRRGRPGP